MSVHVFGGTSSPGCSNYALRKTAVDNASDFKVGVTKTLTENFNVDNLLIKFVESEDSAIQLTQDVTKICQRGGLSLTNLTPTEKVFLN